MKLAVFEKILSLAEKAVWGLPTLLLLVGVGVSLTVRTRFFQFRTFLPMLKHTLGGIFAPKKDKELAARGTVTPFQSLCTALSATIGTGNIAGVAYAMVMGGAGAVFWMWVAAFIAYRQKPVCAAAQCIIWKKALPGSMESLAEAWRSFSAFRRWRLRSAWEI